MRVLHVIRATGMAGAETHLLALLGGLRARGLDAQLALLTTRDQPLHDYRELLRQRGIPLHTFAMRGHLEAEIAAAPARADAGIAPVARAHSSASTQTSTARWRPGGHMCRPW